MPAALRVLVLEDRPADAELMVGELRRVGVDADWQRVETEAEYLQRLSPTLDLILADYALPQFDALRALQMMKERGLDIPFIIVSGSIGEDVAAAAIREGASDYLLKDRLTRLGPAVARALEDKRLRETRRRTEEKLSKLSRAVEQSPAIVVITDTNEIIEYVNPIFTTITGFTPEEVVGTRATELSEELAPQEYTRLLETLSSGGTWRGEFLAHKKTGRHYWELAIVSAIRAPDGTISHYIKVAEDITERKRAEVQIRRQLEHFSALRTIDLAITASLDLRVALNVILDQVTSQLKVDAANVLLFNPATQTLRHALNRGFRTRALQHTDLRLGEGHAGRAALERQTVRVPNLPADLAEFSRSTLLHEEGFIAYIAMPLIAKGQVKGVLEIFHRAPLSPDPEWGSFLEALAGQAAVAMDNATLFSDLQRANADLTLAYDTTLEGWSRALDLRDKETEGHTQRVAELTVRLARAMGMSEAELVHVRRGALLHDIGKMGIPDSILLKPGPLTEGEWEIMRKHPVYAYELLAPIPYLRPALDIPYCHHEKWDGTGYPRGLKGEQIPPAARIFAVVDVWDALRSKRPYRKAWTDEQARTYLREQTDKHFDPNVVKAFLALEV